MLDLSHPIPLSAIKHLLPRFSCWFPWSCLFLVSSLFCLQLSFFLTISSGRGQAKTTLMYFKTIMQSDMPQGRKGKHKQVVTSIPKDIDRLRAGSAVKVRRAGRIGGIQRKSPFCIESCDSGYPCGGSLSCRPYLRSFR